MGSQYRDLDGGRFGKLGPDFGRNRLGESLKFVVGNSLGPNLDADRSASLIGHGLGDALHRPRNLLEILQPLEIVLQRPPSGGGPTGAEGIGQDHQIGRGRSWLDLSMVGADGVQDLFIEPECAQELHPGQSMGAFEFWPEAFSHIMEEAGKPGTAIR